MRHIRGGVKQAVEYIGLMCWGEIRTGDLDFGASIRTI